MMNKIDPNQKIVVLGGGFAGVDAAIALRKKGYNVTLVSNRDYFFLFPISIWIPVGKIDFQRSTLSLTALSKKHKFNLIIDEVQEINGAANQVIMRNQTIDFNYLILAIGAGKMKHPGIEHTHTICGQPEQTLALQKRFEELVHAEKGKIAIGFGGNPNDKSAVRGGPAFEILFNFITRLKELKLYENFQFTFFAPMPEPAKKMGKSGYAMMQKMLKKNGISTVVGKKILGFKPNGIEIEDTPFIESDLSLFIAAGNGHPMVQNSGLPLNAAGFVKIDDNCKVQGVDNVYAVGDVAAIEGPDWIAKQGHTAIIMARNAAYNIHQQILGSEKRKTYQKHHSIICMMDTGNSAAFVYRKNETDFVIPMPIVGHWLKKAWGVHFKFTRLYI